MDNIIPLVMLLIVIIGLASGHPLGFVLGAIAVVFVFFFWGHAALFSMLSKAYMVMDSWVFVALPLFIYMALVLNEAGVAGDLYNSVYKWSGPLRGGLAVATIIACSIFAACTGLAGPGVVMMGTIALPQMNSYKYNRRISMGSIIAGGTLGQLIPPSTLMIIYGLTADVSVGQMFAGGFAAGIILTGIYIAYILIRSYLNPDLCPPLPLENRYRLREKIASLRYLALPVLIIIGVLGSIFIGIATPTEASAVGVIASIIAAAIKGKLSLQFFNRTTLNAIKICAMIGWITLAGSMFSASFAGVGGWELMSQTLNLLGFGNKWGVLIVTVLIIFILGMLLDPVAIVLICAPLFSPVIVSYGFDRLWYALLFMILLQIAYLTPPFGPSIFYLKGVVPKSVNISEIISSVWPFVGLQFVGLAIFIAFPDSILWLPRLLIR